MALVVLLAACASDETRGPDLSGPGARVCSEYWSGAWTELADGDLSQSEFFSIVDQLAERPGAHQVRGLAEALERIEQDWPPIPPEGVPYDTDEFMRTARQIALVNAPVAICNTAGLIDVTATW
jgi:hypothetical protein